MKTLWLYSVRTYLRIGMFFYFRRIHIYNLEHVPKDKPVLLLSNHQNALLDALLIATQNKRFAYFLTRAGVFQKPFISKILKSLQMLPVYRVRDGWSTISKNNAIFDKCSALLQEKKMVIIFPEGSHNLARRVRVLSKGFTRIVFDTLEKYTNTDLQLIPVGLNFKNATQWPDSTSMYFGKPIVAQDFVSDSKNESVVNLKAKIQDQLKQLTTHIPLENYDSNLRVLEERNVDFLNPIEVNACINNNFVGCKSKPESFLNGLRAVLKIVLILNILPPYLVWKYLAKPQIKELEFISTFRFAVSITLVPIYLLSLLILLSIVFSFKLALIYVLSIKLLALITVKL